MRLKGLDLGVLGPRAKRVIPVFIHVWEEILFSEGVSNITCCNNEINETNVEVVLDA